MWRRPWAWAARSMERTGGTALGVPWWKISGIPLSGPETRTSRYRPSRVDIIVMGQIVPHVWRGRVPPRSWQPAATGSSPRNTLAELVDGMTDARLVEVTGGHASIVEDPPQTHEALLGFLKGPCLPTVLNHGSRGIGH